MTNLAISIFILIGIACVIVVISLIAYNRRLDRIARGVERGTHTALPEPGTTADITYKTVLMALMILAVINISTVSGIVLPMQSSVNDLRSSNEKLYREINELHQEISDQLKKVSYSAYEPLSFDPASKTADIKVYAGLKEYSEDTEVSVNLNGKAIPLTLDASGEFSTKLSAGIFDSYRKAKLIINDGGRISSENLDFPEELFWEYLPLPMLQCSFESDYKFGKLSYSGHFSVTAGSHSEDIKTATLTYMSGGRELKSFDISDKIVSGAEITLEKGLVLEKDLSFRIEINTKDGYKITQTSAVIYAADGTDYDDSLTICDSEGTVMWAD
ncbi:MAG: hypothetical protein K5686_13155 [Lachnospiraceae bacterium]|nr:hypothetical protein [Lachnospiraceae bacterium]